MAAEVNAISCPVCCEIYSDPRSLPCGHSFCLNCITGVADRRKTFPCPLCRFSVDLRDETVDKLPRNFGLCIVIDAKDITQASMCLEHNRPLDILCVECNILICSKCLFMQHKGHDSDDIDDIVIKQNMKLVGFLENTAHWTSMIQGKKDELKQSRDRTQRNVDSIQASVDASFKKWYNALHVKQESVLSYLDEETYKIMKKYDETERVLMSSMTNVTEVENEIKKMQRRDKAFVVLQRYSINASLEEVKHKVLMDTRTCLTSFEDIKIAVYAPWIEEAIDNIKPIDMKQTKASHPTKKISEIEEENIILKRRLINLKEKNKMETLDAEVKKLKEELEFLRKKVSEERRKFEKDLQKNREQIKQLEEDRNELLNRLQDHRANVQSYYEGQEGEPYEKELPIPCSLIERNRCTKIGRAEHEDIADISVNQEQGRHAQNKISSEAAARTTHNNPNITDLSDKDRPTKISERYSELYDNQWTDAFDILLKNHDLSEPIAIEVLFDVLYVSFLECKEARKQREALFKSLNEFVGTAEDDQDVTVLEVAKMLNAARKRNIAKMQNHYTEKVQKTLEMKYKEWLQCIRPYIENCIEICLLMNIQNPPLELKGFVLPISDKPSFDLDVFRPYTNSGSKIEYIVWPALYLFKNGPLLCKGVAQGMHDLSKGHKPSSDEHNGNKEEPKTDVNGQKDGPKGELMKNREPNYNNAKNEERVTLFEQKKKVQGTSNSKGSDRDKRSQQSHTNMHDKSQT